MFKTSVICCMLDILRLLMKLPGTECQPNCFKNSSYIFSKGKVYRFYNKEVCSILGGYLVSIETEEEWQFINHEIQKRGTWNTSTTNAWLIGLEKKDGVWIWKSGEQLNISKWRDSEPNVNDERAEISMNRGLFNGISRNDKGDAYICEMPGGKQSDLRERKRE
nr:low affinity immunoglobulin epsilon Fc receptor-like [Pocillopora verrucosa]